MSSPKELHIANCSKEGEAPALLAAASPTAAAVPSSQLWFLEGLTALETLDLSGWRHANASSLRSLSGLTKLTAIKLQRYGNDKATPEAAPVHSRARPIKCPRPNVDSEDSSGSDDDSLSSDGSDGVDQLRSQMAGLALQETVGEDVSPSSVCCCPHAPRCFCEASSRFRAARGHQGSHLFKAAALNGSPNRAPGTPSREEAVVDNGMVHLQGLVNLTHLDLEGECNPHFWAEGRRADGTGGGRQDLALMRNTIAIDLNPPHTCCPAACTGLRDHGVAQLATMSNLRTLHLAGCVRLTGSSLGQLGDKRKKQLFASEAGGGAQDEPCRKAGCRQLEHLCLDDCPLIGTEALSGIAMISSLRTLSLRGCTRVDDEGMRVMSAGLARLSCLSLFSAAGVTARGMLTISKLPYLKLLLLSHCWNVDDEGLLQLAQSRNLSLLSLQHCWKVSESALQAMQQASPAMEILLG